ncbi:MAG: bifunctional D-glycero-beta-D-manno-heptose-7-phosphate kinase/D-glycero-beta-D-manno-heptose 1-phosphate adenylyltransferase HldE [Endozoicomonadaceae bacterium]|nr:bifunctional D-glycero-beta-D-manno-heptose-7-phosphate kinase/D-glycero-beta-D-manno-heptose 1-phosphate adenylyltransferase HldE [Endozoicomonadaceae bacterium]
MFTTKLPSFKNTNILLAGDVMLDRYWTGPAARISPEAPVPVVKVDGMEERPGGAGNVALNLAMLGSSVKLLGVTGKDEAASLLGSKLKAAGVQCEFLEQENQPTIVKLRVLSQHQQLLRLDFENPIKLDELIITQKFTAMLKGTDVCVLSDYGKGVLSYPQAFIQAARANDIPVIIDPKGTDFERYRHATLLTPNLTEFEAIVGHCADEKTLISRGQLLREKLSLEALLITRGEHGMTLLCADQPELHIPTQAREVYDVTGAGDTVIATLAAAIASGQSLQQATILANIAAGIVVGKVGTATITLPELHKNVALRQSKKKRGVVTQEQLLILLEEARSQGERIVFTNGCFDLLNEESVNYLEQAKQHGHRLIVAVNSDESVTNIKGAGRPLNNVNSRMHVLAGLHAVDWVISFDEATPVALIDKIRPDVLIKGGNYTLEEVTGNDLVKSYGGKVITAELVT